MHSGEPNKRVVAKGYIDNPLLKTPNKNSAPSKSGNPQKEEQFFAE